MVKKSGKMKIPNRKTIRALNEIKDKKLREFSNFEGYLNKVVRESARSN